MIGQFRNIKEKVRAEPKPGQEMTGNDNEGVATQQPVELALSMKIYCRRNSIPDFDEKQLPPSKDNSDLEIVENQLHTSQTTDNLDSVDVSTSKTWLCSPRKEEIKSTNKIKRLSNEEENTLDDDAYKRANNATAKDIGHKQQPNSASANTEIDMAQPGPSLVSIKTIQRKLRPVPKPKEFRSHSASLGKRNIRNGRRRHPYSNLNYGIFGQQTRENPYDFNNNLNQ